MSHRKYEGFVFLIGYVLSIPAANWLIGHFGTVCVPRGPCVIPVAPGIEAPSGVLMGGFAFVLRDLVQRRLGRVWSVGAIFAGAVLSAFVAPPIWVIASGLAFLLSESADLVVDAPLQGGRLLTAGFASGCVWLVVDSVAFVYLAFGDLSFLPGQILGKTWMVLISLPVVRWMRGRDMRIGIRAA